jgi:diacylglycerol kinase
MLRFIRSFGFAFNGIKLLLLSERNFQIHFVFFLFVIVFGYIFKISDLEWLIVLLISALVFSMEAINTAIEKLCDFIHPEKHENIKQIKDISSGAVLVASFLAAVIGAIIFLPKLLSYFKIASM